MVKMCHNYKSRSVWDWWTIKCWTTWYRGDSIVKTGNATLWSESLGECHIYQSIIIPMERIWRIIGAMWKPQTTMILGWLVNVLIPLFHIWLKSSFLKDCLYLECKLWTDITFVEDCVRALEILETYSIQIKVAWTLDSFHFDGSFKVDLSWIYGVTQCS